MISPIVDNWRNIVECEWRWTAYPNSDLVVRVTLPMNAVVTPIFGMVAGVVNGQW